MYGRAYLMCGALMARLDFSPVAAAPAPQPAAAARHGFFSYVLVVRPSRRAFLGG